MTDAYNETNGLRAGLRAIADTKVNADTNHAELTALLIATARVTLDNAGREDETAPVDEKCRCSHLEVSHTGNGCQICNGCPRFTHAK